MIKKLYDFRQTVIPAPLLQAEVTREEMDGELQAAAACFTAIAAVDGPIENGDVVTLEAPDAKAEGGIRRFYANVGKGFTDEEDLLPGLRLGAQAGEARIVAIKRPRVPALTDELVCRLGIADIATLAAFEDHVFAKLAEGQRRRKFRGIMGIVSKALLEHTEFEPLEESHPWYQALHTVMMGRIQAFAEQSGMTVEQAMPAALRMQEKSLEECREALKAMCVERARQGALGQALAAENGAAITAEGTEALIGEYVDYLNQTVYQHYAPQIQVARCQ